MADFLQFIVRLTDYERKVFPFERGLEYPISFAEMKLLADVGHYGSRGRSRHGDYPNMRYGVADIRDQTIVTAKIVSPLGDTVRFING